MRIFMKSREERHRVCPLERAGHLERGARKWIHNPKKILGPYVKKGMTVLDYGCGPGFFTVPLAKMVGKKGKVLAVDLQEGMLEKLKNKINGTKLESRIIPRLCKKDDISVTEKVDFVLAFFVAHEIPDLNRFFRQIKSILKPGANILLVEPKKRVTKDEFRETLLAAGRNGFKITEKIKVLFSMGVLLSS